ncbi:Glycosyl transferases group 1 [compost metagenome]
MGHLLLPLAILGCRADLLIIRSTAYSMLLCSLPILIQRLMGAKIVIDVPTPLVSVLEEIKGSKKTKFEKIFLRTLVKLNYPLALYPAHRVIQYSEESARFSFGLKRRMFFGANGIDVSSIDLREDKKNKQTNVITLIGVAALEEWHGYDRVIQGISNYYKNKKVITTQENDINFIIVGSGGAEPRLKAMAQDLEVSQHVSFKGTLNGQALTEAFNQADVAVASLGLHRIGLYKASVLKSREYLARGFPILVSTDDPDIPDTNDFVYRSKADDTAVDIERLIEWHKTYVAIGCTAAIIRNFAAQHLDYKSKVSTYTEVLLTESSEVSSEN